MDFVPIRRIRLTLITLILAFAFLAYSPGTSMAASGKTVLPGIINNILVDNNRCLVYAADNSSNSIVVMDSWSDKVIKNISLGVAPNDMAISQNGSELYVALPGSNQIAVINLQTLSLSRTITISASPINICAGRAGRLYVSTSEALGYPRIVDTINNTEIANITGAGKLYGGAQLKATSDGKFLFIGGYDSLHQTIICKFGLGDKNSTYLGKYSSSLTGTDLTDMQLSPDDNLLFACFNTPYYIFILNTGNFTAYKNIYDANNPNSITLVCNDNYILSSYINQVNVFDYEIRIVNTTSDWVLSTLHFSEGTIKIQAMENGSRLFGITRSKTLEAMWLTPSATITVSPSCGRSSISFVTNITSAVDPYGSPTDLKYRWDWQNDGIWDTDWTSLTSFQHQYLAQGKYVICLELLGKDNRTALMTSTVIVDDTPPITNFGVRGTLGANGWYVSSTSIDLTPSDSLSNVVSTYWRLDKGPWTLVLGGIVVSSQGNHTVEFFSTDSAGNSETVVSRYLAIDSETPVLTINEQKNAYFSSPSFSISWSCVDDASGIDETHYSLDGGPNISCTTGSPIDLSGIKEGEHIINITAKDVAGNTITESLTFNVDNNIFSANGPFGPFLILVMAFAFVGIISFAIARSFKKKSVRVKGDLRTGKPVNAGTVSNPLQSPTIPQHQILPVFPQGSLPERIPNYVICVACGTHNPFGMRYCGNCKAQLYPSSAEVHEPSQKTGASRSLRMCDSCGNLFDKSLMACPHCNRDYSAPQYHTYQFDSSLPSGKLTATPTIGLLISLISALLGVVTVFYVYLSLPAGHYFLGWFSLLLTFMLICGVVSILFSLYAIARRNFVAAILGSILSIIAGWALLGIFTVTVAVFGLILIVTGRDDFRVYDKSTKNESSQKAESWKGLNTTRKGFRIAKIVPFVVGMFIMIQSYFIPDFLIRFAAGFLIMLLAIPIDVLDKFFSKQDESGLDFGEQSGKNLSPDEGTSDLKEIIYDLGRSEFPMNQYAEFFDQLAQRLGGEGFSVTRNVATSDYNFDMIAVRSAFELSKFGEMTRFIIAAAMNSVDAKTVQDYSSKSTKYALDNRNSLLPRGFGGSLLSVPVIVSDNFTDELKNWMTETLAEKHWSAFEFPVLISPKTRQIFYCKKTPLLGAVYYKGFRKFVEQKLGFKR